MGLTRREFLQIAAAAGVAVLPLPRALAQTPAQNRYWLTIHAIGGWDPSSFCTPKGNGGQSPVNNFPASMIKTAGGHAYSPYMGPTMTYLDPLTGAADGNDYYDRFYQKYASQLLFINGIDVGTMDHDAGSFLGTTGAADTYPAFGALAASVIGPGKPMAFTSNGRYDRQAGLIGTSPPDASGPALQAVQDVALPNSVAPVGNPNARFQTDTVWDKLVRPAQDARLRAAIRDDGVVARNAQRSVLYTARTGAASLRDLATYLKPADTPLPSGCDQLGVMLAAFAADIAVAGHLSFNVGGDNYDTHDNHDRRQCVQVDGVFRAVDFFMTKASALGIADKVNVSVVSDFGRGPFYNGAAGKDHHTVTSYFFLGADIRGNRAVGAVDDQLGAMAIDPVTLKPSASGVILTPAHIQCALRDLAKIGDSTNAQMYPFKEASLPLFT